MKSDVYGVRSIHSQDVGDQGRRQKGAEVGDQVRIELAAVSGAQEILGFNAVLTFDPNQVRFDSFGLKGLISGLMIHQIPEASPISVGFS